MTDFNTAKDTFLESLSSPEHLFTNTMAFIEAWYIFTPSAFVNGDVENSAEQNQGSAKVFALTQILDFAQEQTLQCFGEYHREVLATPDIDNHHNLRRILREGNSGISFENFPLQAK